MSEAGTMDVTVKRMVRFEGDGTLKAFCDIAVGEQFLIKGLRVVDGRNGVFVSMPRQQGKNGKWFDSVSAISKEAKKVLDQVVLEAYEQETVPQARE